ncbi:MAG: hypothetical protein LBQ88_22290 [Treponema sp.]|jgi:hypothetical protein|nr:hypothetical protein [Treponema sp.]
MKKMVFCVIPLMILMGCISSGKANTNQGQSQGAQSTPDWVQNPEQAYPSTDWVAVTGQGAGQKEAEDAAMNALARAFKTDIASLTEANQRFFQIVNDVAGKKSVNFNEGRDFSSQVKTASSVKALIGVETGIFQSAEGTWYANARMNRRECAARYAGMVRENEAVIKTLLGRAATLEGRSGFEAYAALYYAASVAQVTDNFQNILEVLDPSSVNRRPGYGGAAAIKTRMLTMSGRITLGLSVETEDRQEAVTIRRALGALFTGMGFKVNEQGMGDYILNARVMFEVVDTTQVRTCRWFLDAALKARDGRVLFSYTGQDRAAHFLDQEARRLALRDVESSVKEGDFAGNFDAWLGSLLE